MAALLFIRGFVLAEAGTAPQLSQAPVERVSWRGVFPRSVSRHSKDRAPSAVPSTFMRLAQFPNQGSLESPPSAAKRVAGKRRREVVLPAGGGPLIESGPIIPENRSLIGHDKAQEAKRRGKMPHGLLATCRVKQSAFDQSASDLLSLRCNSRNCSQAAINIFE